METPAVKEIIRKKEHYDLLLTEHGMEVSLGFSHIFKAPVIQISSLGHLFFSDKSVGSDIHPFLYPCPMNQRVYNLTKFEKIQTIWNGLKLISAFKVLNRETDVIIKKIFGQDTPSFNELKENIHMTMLNVHPIWIDNQPLSPNVILIGGIHEKLPTPLPQDLQEHLDSSKNGTIYVSFGSKATLSNFTPETVKILLEVLCNLPFDVLLRWEEDKLPADCTNIRVSKWFPQADVLRHPRVKLFITQGGLQSTDEAISGGVPLIGIPIMGDQYYNSEKYVHHGIGKKLDWYDFDARTFRDAIEEIINNVSYHDSIIRLRTLMKDSPHSPLERAIWWAEYVLRHGARHLAPPTAHITLYEYLEIDLLIYIILWLIMSVGVIVITVYIVVKYIRRRLSRKKEKLF
ncbi:UDP-glycosyltransferase UGT5-like [Aricia agestis]|uniref:UDP-glycosyltransferase UGT5-like n=1 Tax=Aricia agestis TaxID=91739 RepID=UPI001C207E9D|nr:UDP-glycosyltransferase UGT5-like [Aricia agestis]